jgi:hypothetical protein
MRAPGIVPKMTSNTLPLGTASSTAGGTATAYLAFDRSTTTYWQETDSGRGLIYHVAGAGILLTSYDLTSGANASIPLTSLPASWLVRGSNNGTDWTTLDTVANDTIFTDNETRQYQIATPGSTTYTWFEFLLQANQGFIEDGHDISRVVGLQFRGYVPGRLYFIDRLKESTTTEGTGDITLAGNPMGFRSFSDYLTTGMIFNYCIDTLTGSWETGLGTFQADGTIARTTVYTSTNSNALLDLAAGTKVIFLTVDSVYLRELGVVLWGS